METGRTVTARLLPPSDLEKFMHELSFMMTTLYYQYLVYLFLVRKQTLTNDKFKF